MAIIPQEKLKRKLPPLPGLSQTPSTATPPPPPLTTPSPVAGPNTTSTPPASTQPTAPVKSWDQMSMWEKTKAFIKEIPSTVLDPNNYKVPQGKSWDELNAMQKISGVAQEIPHTITDPNFLKTIPRTVYESEKEAAKIPIKFTYSAIQALKPGGDLGTGIKDVITGKSTPTKDDSLNLPIFGKISTYQKDFIPIADDVIEGKRPLWHALAPFVQVPLDAMFTSSLLDMGAKYILKKIPVNNAQVAAAINKLGLTDLSPEAQSVQYRRLAHEFHPDLAGEKSTKLMSELNQANDILEKAREQGTLVASPSKLAAAMRDLAEKGTSDVRDLFKLKDTSPYLDVKGLLPEQAGTIPEPTYKPYRQPAFGLSIKEVGGKPIPRPEPLQRVLKSFQYNLEMQVARYSPEGGDIIKNLDLSKVASVDEAANLAMSSLPPKIAQDKVIADSVIAWRDSAKQIQQFQEETVKPISTAIQQSVTKFKPKAISEDSALDRAFKDFTSDTLPILENAVVRNGKIMLTDLNGATVRKTTLPDGVYKRVGKDFIKTELDPKEYPVVPEGPGEPVAQGIDSDTIANEFKKAAKYTAKSEIRPELQGVQLNVKDGNLTIFSTDSFALYHKSIPVSGIKDGSFIVSSPQRVAATLPTLGDNINISTLSDKDGIPNSIIFEGDRGKIVERLVYGNYPPVEQVYPQFKTQIIIDKKALSSALKELAPYVKKLPREKIIVTQKDGNLELLAKNEAENISKKITIPFQEVPVTAPQGIKEGALLMPITPESGAVAGTFALNRKLLNNILSTLDGENVHLSQSGLNGGPLHIADRDVFSPSKTISTAIKNINKGTQKRAVAEAIKKAPKSIKEIAEETKILEPNVRRILGVGAKEGVFQRIEKGVYVLSKDGQDLAYVQVGDALETLPKLAKEGFKADMVFLDIPYKTSGVTGGNRGIDFGTISVEEFGKTIVPAVKQIAKTPDSPIVYMYSNSKSGLPQMLKYNEQIIRSGLQIVAKGTYTKIYKNGTPMKFGKYPMPPEGILIFNQSGKEVSMPAAFDVKAIAPLYKGHYQTEKAKDLLKAVIEGTTKVGDLVLDPFSGSGVTAEQAIITGRKAYAVEKSPEAVKKHIIPRITKALEAINDSFKTGDKIKFQGKEGTVGTVLKKKDDTKYEIIGKDGKSIWTNKLGIENENLPKTKEAWIEERKSKIGNFAKALKDQKSANWQKEYGQTDEEVKKDTMALAQMVKKALSKKSPSTFYRGGGEGSMPKGKTAEDIINYEKQDLGNDIKVEPGINPKEIKSENLTWLTDTPEAAKEYGDVSKVSLGKNRIVARDNYGGVLVEKNPIDPVIKATGLEDIANELSKEYGGKIPLYHATSMENAKKIISDGLQTTQGKNYKHWGDEDQIYFQIGKSDYKSVERPIVFKTEVDKDWFIQNASADMDGVSVTEKDILDKTGVDISELDSDTRDMIQAYYNNGEKFKGLELLVRNPDGGDLTIKNIEQVAGPKVVDEKKKAIAKLLQVLSKPPKTPPVTPSSINKMINPPSPLVTKSEDFLLRKKMKDIKRGNVLGYQAGTTDTRIRIYDKLRTKMAEMKGVKDQIIGYVKETIPPKDRGRFLNMVANAQTQRNLIKSFVRIDKVAESVQKKIAVSELTKKLKDIENSGKISVEYKPIIKKMVEDIELKGHTSGKIEELKATREFIEREKAKGNDVTMPEYVLDSLKILDRKPLKDLSLAELQVISDKIDVLKQLGETKLASKENLDNLIKEKWTKELSKGTVSLEKNPLIAPKLRHLTLWEKVKNSIARGRNAKIDVDYALTDPEVLADMLDGNAHYLGPNYRIFFKPQSINYGNYLQGRVNFHDTVIGLMKKNGINDVDLFGERLFIELNKHQKGGVEKLLENGYTQEQIDSVNLTPGETNIYNFVREYYDNAGKRAESFIQKTYNKEFKLQENYSPWWTDYKAMSESIDPATSKAPEVWEKFANPIEYRPPKKTVEFGWMKSRTGGKNIIKHNAIEDLLKHNDDLEYMTNMGADTKRLFEIANSPAYAEMAGKEGQSRMITWLNSIARKGGSIGETQTGWIDAARGAVGAGSMALKLSTVLIQFTSLFDAATQIGPWAFKGMFRFATSKEARDFLYKNAPEWKARFGKEYAMSEFSTNKLLAKYQQMGYKPMAKADSFTAGSALLGAYEKYLVEHGLPLDFTTVNKDAMYEAQRIMRRTQGTGEFIYQPPEIVHGVLTKNRSLSKAIWQFQSFNLTGRWNYIKHDLWVYGIKEKDPKVAVNMLFWLTVAAFAGVGMRQLAKRATGGEPNPEDTLTSSTAQELLQTIPFVSMLTSMGKFKGEPVPILDIPRQIFTATDQIGGKSPETKRKGYIKLAEVLGKAGGVPGASQAGEIARNLTGTTSSTKKSSSLPTLPGLKKSTKTKRKGLPKLKKISR